MTKICAVIVTYNRLTLLKECLETVLHQTRAIDKVIIVDNASSDGTRAWLETLEARHIQIIHQDNVGGAGGFHTGIREAYEQGFDWVWLMDDDVETTENCLETLLRYESISKCLHPVKKYMDGKTFEWQHTLVPHTGEKIVLGNYLFRHGNEICFLNVGNFEGMLIHRSIIEKIGYPNTDYFIVEDDTEYGYRASFYTNVSYVRDAVLIRKKMQSDEKETPFYLYYKYRNQFILMRNMRRHPIYSFPKRRFLNRIIKDTYREIKGLFRAKDPQKYVKIKAVARGFWDGVNKKTGSTF